MKIWTKVRYMQTDIDSQILVLIIKNKKIWKNSAKMILF